MMATALAVFERGP